MKEQGNLLGKKRSTDFAFWLEEGQNLAKRNESLQLSLATLYSRCKFEVRSLANACAVKIFKENVTTIFKIMSTEVVIIRWFQK